MRGRGGRRRVVKRRGGGERQQYSCSAVQSINERTGFPVHQTMAAV